MLISHKYKFIFIHIQKTGGSSIEKAFKDYDKDACFNTPTKNNENIAFKGRHLFARDVKGFVGNKIWNDYFKFSIVRNPWERLLSWYRMIKEIGDTNSDIRFWKFIISNSTNFELFLENCKDVFVEQTGEKKSISFNQLDYLTDENGDLIVNFVGRFENLGQDFNKICKEIDIFMPLPHINRSNHHHYNYYYTDYTKKLVSQMYMKDISFFKYIYED